MSDLMIYKKNDLIENFIFNATEKELQILNYAVAITNPTKENNNLIYVITVAELVKTYKTNSRSAYAEYKAALERLMRREYCFRIENIEYKENLVIRTGTKTDGSDWLEFKLNDFISQRISKLKGLFTKYDIKHIARFTSRYAFMLYEFFKMNLEQIQEEKYQKVFKKLFTIEDFKKKLGLENKYKEFYKLELKVIKLAKSNINKHSNIDFTYTIKRGGVKGRTPVAILLKAKYKKEKTTIENNKTEVINDIKTQETLDLAKLNMAKINKLMKK